MKRILLPAGGAVLATGLLAAGLAGTAQAAPDWSTDPLANKPQDAYSVAQFWTDQNGAALKKATEYYWDSKHVTKLSSGGGYTPDGKPGLTAPIGYEGTKAAKVKNINLPKTIGKVFFVNSKGEPKWCSATSIQSKYRNLVATAGHCVYDVDSNKDVLDKWVFVPGYYQGKAPWGVYVGKQAFTHYDFDNYEDYDRDYAFVTVYNGISLDGKKEVKKDEYDKWVGDRWPEHFKVTEKEYLEWAGKGGTVWIKDPVSTEAVGPDYPGAVYAPYQVTKAVYDAAGAVDVKKPGTKAYTVIEHVTESQWKDSAYVGDGTPGRDAADNWIITRYYLKSWVKPGSDKEYYITKYFLGLVKDRGTLGSNVGGQGFAWNQKTGQPTWVFGYPASAHPDGNKPYTGITPKWCYSKKPSGKTFASAANKAEEHIALKCAMTPGADGGPWLIKYSNAKRLGYVNGVTSLFHDQDGNDRIDYVSSPYFDGETATVYAKAANQWSGKIVGPGGEILK